MTLDPSLIELVGSLSVAVVTGLLTVISTKVKALLAARAEKEQAAASDVQRAAHERQMAAAQVAVEKAANAAIAFVENTRVKQAKSNGSWTEVAQEEARNSAVQLAKDLLGDARITAWADSFGVPASTINMTLSAEVERLLSTKKPADKLPPFLQGNQMK